MIFTNKKLLEIIWFLNIFSNSSFIRLNENDNINLELLKFEDSEHISDMAFIEINSKINLAIVNSIFINFTVRSNNNFKLLN